MGSMASDARILIVEDDDLIAFALEAQITAHGYQVIGPYGRPYGAVHALRRPISIAAGILDFNLGLLTSVPVARALQARDLPFVFTTGGSSSLMRKEFPHVPVFLKPYDVEEILAFLASC